jgi:phage baseplate assembly protein V
MIRRIINRVKNILSQGLIRSVDDSTDIQLVKVAGKSGDVSDEIERIQNYGLSSVPPNDCESIIARLNGDTESSFVIACDNCSDRPKGKDIGDTNLYSIHGQNIEMNSSGNTIATQSGTFNVGSEAPINFVANATTINIFLDTLMNQVSPGGTPILTPPPLTNCPVAIALRAAMTAACPPALAPANTGVTKLKSE